MIDDKLYQWTQFAIRDDLGTPVGIQKDAPQWAKENYKQCKKQEAEWEKQGIDV